MNNKNEKCHYEIRFLKQRQLFILFSFLSILIPLLSLIDALRPAGEEFNSWFQRSGSTMVVFALLAEMRAYQLFDIFKPSGIVADTYKDTETKYKYQVKLCNVIAFTLIAVGTIIWGYGDLLV